MGLTKLNFNEISGASEAPSGININKTVSFKQQVILPTITPQNNEVDGAIWVDESSANLKVKINLVTYDVSPKTDYNNLSIPSPYTFFLNGNTAIVNNLTITGNGTVVNLRSTTLDGPKWSILEVKGDLTIDSGCTLNLIRTPIIVRGSILGSGVITSPNGVDGGAGGVGGPGGLGGLGGSVSLSGVSPAPSGNAAPSTWTGLSGLPGSSMEIEYNVLSGPGGNGGRGTAGGGGGGGAVKNPQPYIMYSSGGSSGNGNSGGGGGNGGIGPRAGGGGGSGGAGTPYPTGTGGIGSNGTIGDSGQSAEVLNTPYIGVGTSSPFDYGEYGTFGGQGGQGVLSVPGIPWSTPGYNESGSPGSPGGRGGNGGSGGSTGGAMISILSVGPISSTLTIRPGKGGLNGGNVSFARAQTGPLYLFTPTGSELIPGIDLTGSPGTPTGASGTLNMVALSNASGVSDFFTAILFEASGSTPAKNQISLTYP